VLRTHVETYVAGRTDAGVHALGQVVGCPDAPDGIDLDRVKDALNGMCGPAIAVSRCAEAPEDWHPRHSARSRLYVYAVLESDVPDPFLARTTYRRPRSLDLNAVNEAAGHLLGEHDFSSFGRVLSPEGSAVRNLYELRATRNGRVVRIRARGNSFIQQMVRSLAGTLVEVGEGRRDPSEMPAVLEARDRAAAGIVAPPEGLCLVAVEYDEGWSRPVDPIE
jgi:tRNA pseudouridine38-40 synthase